MQSWPSRHVWAAFLDNWHVAGRQQLYNIHITTLKRNQPFVRTPHIVNTTQKGSAMSIFSTILQKLGIQKPAAPAVQAAPPAAKPAGGPPPTTSPAFAPRPMAPAPGAQVPPAPRPAPMAMVDVVSKLEKMAGDTPGLDWKVSIVDMLKLLGMDSSLKARKELATELGCPADLMKGDYAKMNVWLHQTVLQKIAENGGNIPQSRLRK